VHEQVNLDQRLDLLSELAAKMPLAQVYFDSLVESLCEATNARAAAVWTVEGSRYRLQAERNLSSIGIHELESVRVQHEQGLELACRSDERSARVIDDDGKIFYFFFAGDLDGDTFLVLEIATDPISEGTESTLLAILAAFHETAREFRSRSTIQSLKRQLEGFQAWSQRIPKWYACEHFDQTAFLIANDLLEMGGYHRVSIGSVRGTRVKLAVISGTPVLDRRAKQVALMEEFMTFVARANLRVAYPSDEELPPSLAVLAEHYIDASGASSICMETWNLPHETRGTRDAAAPFSVVSIENFHSSRAEIPEGLEFVFQQAESALGLAWKRDRGWFLRTGKWLDQWYKRIAASRWAGTGLGIAIVGSLLALFTIPIEYEVWAEGVYECSLSRDVFAPLDAEVVEMRVDHESRVQQGDVLLMLQSRTLDLKREELMTQREVAMEKLRALEASRLGDRRNRPQDPAMPTDWSAAEKELRELVAGQNEQLGIIDKMIASLTLQSPITGQVISWNNTKDWISRPVRQGQRLVSIVDLQSQGQLRLTIDDRDARALFRRTRENNEPVEVRFTFVNDPTVTHRAEVVRTAINAERSDRVGRSIRVEAVVAVGQNVSPQPGAKVRGRIPCGDTTLGGLWCSRILQQWRLWWYF
jgi:hypothetical protein